MTRDERQDLSVKKWIQNKCKGTVVASTGFGKTRVAIKAINKILKQKPLYKILVVVPTLGLQEQWITILDKSGFSLNAQVVVINTASTHLYECDLLIEDECHRFSSNTFKNIFNTVKYKYVLGLTATFERLDGKHAIMAMYCPVIDEVTTRECMLNGWIAPYKEYHVILDAPDIEEYKKMNREFVKHFEFFDFSWDIVQNCCGPKGMAFRYKLAKEMAPYGDREKQLKLITNHAVQTMHLVQQRKAFINNHPKKIQVAQKIIEARPDCKIITFSNNIKTAESIGGGYVYTGKESKKKCRITLEEFKSMERGVLHTVKKADTGLDIPGLSVAIMLGIDSSRIRAIQSRGRVVRKEGDKIAEIFVLTIDGTVEQKWFAKSRANDNVITIDEHGLDAVLRHEEPEEFMRNTSNFSYRF